MDRETTEYLQMLLKKDVSELTELDVGFLRARAAYLTKEQLEKIRGMYEKPTNRKVTEEELNDSGIFIEEVEGGFLVSKCGDDEAFVYHGKKNSSEDQLLVTDVFKSREDALKKAIKLL